MKSKLLGRLGVWLCDRNFPRPSTKSEHAQCMQYVGLMVDVLRGEVSYYGRDREQQSVLVADPIRLAGAHAEEKPHD